MEKGTLPIHGLVDNYESYDDALALAFAGIMNAFESPHRYKAGHATRGTPPRQRFRRGRGMELHRLRKARRLEPCAPWGVRA